MNNIYKGFYQIVFSSDNLLISVPRSEVGMLKFKRFIKFKITHLHEKTSQSKIKILDRDVLHNIEMTYLFDDFFIGQIISLKVYEFDQFNVYLNHERNDDWIFIVNIREISYSYVKDINDFVSIGQEIQVKIIEYNKKFKKIFCSIKALTKNQIKDTLNLSNEDLIERIKKLQELLGY